MLFSKQTPAAGGTAFAQFDAAWCYDGNGYILNETGTSLDVRIGATGSVITLAAGGTLPIKLVYSMAELYVRRTDQSTTQVTVEAQVGTGSAGGGTSAEVGVIAAATASAAVAGLKLPYPTVAMRLPRTPTIVTLGDSLCAGNTYNPDREQNMEGWGQQISLLSNGSLRLRHNAGVPSDTSALALGRLNDDVLGFAPDICVVGLGTNDMTVINPTISDDAFLANMSEIIRRVRESGCVVVVAGIPPISDVAANARIVTVNAKLRNLCAVKCVVFADVYSRLINPNGSQNADMFKADGVHYVEAGAKAAASTILEAIGWYDSGCDFLPFAVESVNLLSPISGGVSGSPGTAPAGWTIDGSGYTSTFTTDSAGVTWWRLAASASTPVFVVGDVSAVLESSSRAQFGCVVKPGTSSPANGEIAFNLQTTNNGVMVSHIPLWLEVESVGGVISLETPVGPANTANIIVIAVGAGLSFEFALPFLYVRPNPA